MTHRSDDNAQSFNHLELPELQWSAISIRVDDVGQEG